MIMFDNRWDNWVGDFGESFAASTLALGTRSSIAEILYQFGVAARRLDPSFPDSVSGGTFRAVFAEHLSRLNLAPAVRDDAPEVVARFFEFLQDGGRLGDGYEWAEAVRQLKIGPVPTSSPRSTQPGAPIRNTPKTSVGRNDPCPCGSGKKYKKCCYA